MSLKKAYLRSRLDDDVHTRLYQAHSTTAWRTRNWIQQGLKTDGESNFKKFPQWKMGDWTYNRIRSVEKTIVRRDKIGSHKTKANPIFSTDASDTHCSGILTQFPEECRNLRLGEKKHEPLAFLSCEFTSTIFNWNIAEKEGFAIVESITRRDYTTSTSCTSIFTNHANLVYIFDPAGTNPGIRKHTASKLTRWKQKINDFRLIIEHIEGEKHVRSDMLTPSAVQPRNEIARFKVSLTSLIIAPNITAHNKNLRLPTHADIQKSQIQHKKRV